MKILLRQIEAPLEYSEDELLAAAAHRLECDRQLIISCEIVRRSLDSRPRRSQPVFVFTLELEMNSAFKLQQTNNKDVEILTEETATPQPQPFKSLPDGFNRPVVVGAGPAGLMAALHLAEMGCRPILIERGCRAEERRAVVDAFWRDGAFNSENNTLFGEGGAGLFSDGKLTARSKDRPRIKQFFETLVKCGAPQEILIDSEPHLGSDVLLKIVPNIRQMIEKYGGETRYNTTLTHIFTENGNIKGIEAGGHKITTENLILATGHSARDVYHLLAESEATLQAKPFAVGIRLEIPQKQINLAQYGKFATHERLGAASFKLTRRPEKDLRACYSFCMCPGGLVIACASEEGALTTNGMSYSARKSVWGNAAFIVPIEPADFAGCPGAEKHPELAGLNFQIAMEKAAFKAGGSDFNVPALRLKDFLADKISASLPNDRSCPRSVPASFNSILPDFVIATLRGALPRMLRELNTVEPSSIIAYAAETRSSSPVRVVRKDNGESPSLGGLFPAGEGAGYAGGIVSSAVDGLKAAELMIEKMRIS
ncbi:MAG: hypothetical protein EOM80_09090 [Erysipelotrichia bacterium]|nr:hypothetical protein [Erysipelotrichia bacterium]